MEPELGGCQQDLKRVVSEASSLLLIPILHIITKPAEQRKPSSEREEPGQPFLSLASFFPPSSDVWLVGGKEP